MDKIANALIKANEIVKKIENTNSSEKGKIPDIAAILLSIEEKKTKNKKIFKVSDINNVINNPNFLKIKKHGLTKHPLYCVWHNMKTRCYNPKRKAYKYYGGRGITVCDEWLFDFEAFYTWAINNGYKKGLQIDRENNDKNYNPENCRFITPRENVRNRGKHIYYTKNL